MREKSYLEDLIINEQKEGNEKEGGKDNNHKRPNSRLHNNRHSHYTLDLEGLSLNSCFKSKKHTQETQQEIPQFNSRHKKLHLPEANPILLPSKPRDFKPRILQNDYKYQELPLTLNMNMEGVVCTQKDLDKMAEDDMLIAPTKDSSENMMALLSSTNLASQQQLGVSTSGQQGSLMEGGDFIGTLYQKYVQSKQFKLCYSKTLDKRPPEEQARNYAGQGLNLSCVMDFGSTMFFTLIPHKLVSRDPALEFDMRCRYEREKRDEIIAQKDEIEFDSRFECGNLYQAFTRVHNKEYDLIVQNDSNTKGYSQWFFFKVSNYRFTNITVTFRLVNLAKGGYLFNCGMKPAIFSLRLWEKKRIGWQRQGKRVSLHKGLALKESDPSQRYDTLQFTYVFEHEDDEVYFSLNLPYSYTKMVNHVDSALRDVRSRRNIIAIKDILCHSVSNNAVPILSITGRSEDCEEGDREQIKNNKKKTAWIIARQHPGETVSSYVMEGVINYLLGSSIEAIFLRSQFVFKIIPMMNPDGVIYGNSRCNLAGVDINRQWIEPSKILHPTVFAAKKAIKQTRDDGQMIDYFIDLHGHSKKDCTFALEQYKESAARIAVWNEINDPEEDIYEAINVFTLETSFFGQNTVNKKAHFQITDLHSLGIDLLKTMYFYSVPDGQQAKEAEDRYFINKKKIMEKLQLDIQQFMEKGSNIPDSGSDSDPLADELKIEEKIGSIIPMKVAKKLGYEVKEKEIKKQSGSQPSPNKKNKKHKRRKKHSKKNQEANQNKEGSDPNAIESSSQIKQKQGGEVLEPEKEEKKESQKYQRTPSNSQQQNQIYQIKQGSQSTKQLGDQFQQKQQGDRESQKQQGDQQYQKSSPIKKLSVCGKDEMKELQENFRSSPKKSSVCNDNKELQENFKSKMTSILKRNMSQDLLIAEEYEEFKGYESSRQFDSPNFRNIDMRSSKQKDDNFMKTPIRQQKGILKDVFQKQKEEDLFSKRLKKEEEQLSSPRKFDRKESLTFLAQRQFSSNQLSSPQLESNNSPSNSEFQQYQEQIESRTSYQESISDHQFKIVNDSLLSQALALREERPQQQYVPNVIDQMNRMNPQIKSQKSSQSFFNKEKMKEAVNKHRMNKKLWQQYEQSPQILNGQLSQIESEQLQMALSQQDFDESQQEQEGQEISYQDQQNLLYSQIELDSYQPNQISLSSRYTLHRKSLSKFIQVKSNNIESEQTIGLASKTGYLKYSERQNKAETYNNYQAKMYTQNSQIQQDLSQSALPSVYPAQQIFHASASATNFTSENKEINVGCELNQETIQQQIAPLLQKSPSKIIQSKALLLNPCYFLPKTSLTVKQTNEKSIKVSSNINVKLSSNKDNAPQDNSVAFSNTNGIQLTKMQSSGCIPSTQGNSQTQSNATSSSSNNNFKHVTSKIQKQKQSVLVTQNLQFQVMQQQQNQQPIQSQFQSSPPLRKIDKGNNDQSKRAEQNRARSSTTTQSFQNQDNIDFQIYMLNQAKIFDDEDKIKKNTQKKEEVSPRILAQLKHTKKQDNFQIARQQQNQIFQRQESCQNQKAEGAGGKLYKQSSLDQKQENLPNLQGITKYLLGQSKNPLMIKQDKSDYVPLKPQFTKNQHYHFSASPSKKMALMLNKNDILPPLNCESPVMQKESNPFSNKKERMSGGFQQQKEMVTPLKEQPGYEIKNSTKRGLFYQNVLKS